MSEFISLLIQAVQRRADSPLLETSVSQSAHTDDERGAFKLPCVP